MEYVVGESCSFINKGKLYKAGDKIDGSIFSNDKDFAAMVKAGFIKEVKAEEAKTEEAKTEETEKKTKKKEEKK